MSRHRRQASQVLPPEILTGDGRLGEPLVQANAGIAVVGHSSEGSTTTVNGRANNPSTTTHPHQQSIAAHFPSKNSLPGKPA
ncbi:hypothetical protein P3X46_015526 [Hevea brasiliensis]|uniref:SMP domain-containing protein n=1 Tax=Hevea brasiliensis TaxID=3981 RepID=A0ABQ9M091_HEVBR|nr:hypothetical protein P3X46_015526 [Hevea brasiliensis]